MIYQALYKALFYVIFYFLQLSFRRGYCYIQEAKKPHW